VVSNVSAKVPATLPAMSTRRRAPWGTMSREQVVQAAMGVVAAGGFEDMTIRSLAAQLGVAPMSLYRHVRDKNDLLTEVVDRMLAKVWRPRGSAQLWQAWIAEAAERLRSFLVEQPVALHVFLLGPVVSPANVARMDAMVEVLRSAGIGADAAGRAFAALHTYTIGFAALQASRRRVQNAAQEGLVAELAAYTTPEQFAVGLRYLLEGIERDELGTQGSWVVPS
jgi:TetR/AcrR family transcriptional regulator, tetracycline repressor protein